MSYRIMWTLLSLPLQMAERLPRAQPDSVANHVKARPVSYTHLTLPTNREV